MISSIMTQLVASPPLLPSLNIITLPVIIVVLQLVSNVMTIYRLERTEPSILLLGYRPEDTVNFVAAESEYHYNSFHDNDYLSKVGNDYVITEYISMVDFTCSADYPVTFSFPFPEQIKHVKKANLGSEERRTYNTLEKRPTNELFKTNIRLLLDVVDFLSVNLTCNSALPHMPNLQSSIHIYLKGKSSIERDGEILQVFAPGAPPNSRLIPSRDMSLVLPPVVLPCRPSTPDVKIFLYQQETYMSTFSPTNLFSKRKRWTVWKAVAMDSDSPFTFDPKIGFTVHRGLFGNRIFGSYKCSVMVSNSDDDKGVNSTVGEYVESDEFVYVNLTQQVNSTPPVSKPIFEPRKILHGKATLYFTGPPVAKFTCCSGVADKPPMSFIQGCHDSLQCDLLKDSVLENIANGNLTKLKNQARALFPGLPKPLAISSDCTEEHLYFSNFIVVCRGENVDYMDHLVSVFHPLAGAPVTNRSKGILESKNIPKNNHLTSVSLTQSVSAAVVETINATQKMIVLFARELDVKELYMPQRSIVLTGHFVHVFNYDIEDAYTHTYKNGIRIALPAQYLIEYDRDVYYENEPISFMCFGLKYAYAAPPYMKLVWKNETTTLLEKKEVHYVGQVGISSNTIHLSGQTTMFNGAVNEVSTIAKSVLAMSEMKSVDCWMPKKNSVEWDVISKEIQVLPSVAPSFKEDLEETVYVYLGDVDQVVLCTLRRGLPLAKISVQKDGKQVHLNIIRADVKNVTQQRHGRNGRRRRPQVNAIRPTEDVYFNQKEIVVRIRIFPVLHSNQGVVECKATNANSTVVRKVTIFVIEKHGIAFPVTISCVIGTLVLIIVGLGIKRWRDRRAVRSCRQATNTY